MTTTPTPSVPPTRLIVVGIVQNARREYLLCRMPADRGVFPGQWGLPGGGVEPGEPLEQALRREIREEVGLELRSLRGLFFTDATYAKAFADGTRRDIHMVFLLFKCLAAPGEIRLNPEFDAADWVPRRRLSSYALNGATRATFARIGLLAEPAGP